MPLKQEKNTLISDL